MDPEKRKEWLRLRKQAGIEDDRQVFTTKKRPTLSQQEEVEKRIAKSAKSEEFEKERKEQDKHAEWKKSPYQTAEKVEL